MDDLGKRLHYLLDKHRISQSKLSQASGIGTGSLSNWMDPKKPHPNPTLYNLIRLANGFGVTLDELVGREPPPPPKQRRLTDCTRNIRVYLDQLDEIIGATDAPDPHESADEGEKQ